MYTILSSPYSVPPYFLTQCLIRLDRLTKSTHNTESTLGLAAASNLQRLGVESSNEKNNL